jgi:hypothetical protein
MIHDEASSQPVIARLTSSATRVQIRSKSRPDLSDKNGRQTGRKSRREAVFAFPGL